MNLRVRPRVKRAANRGAYNQQFHKKGVLEVDVVKAKFLKPMFFCCKNFSSV